MGYYTHYSIHIQNYYSDQEPEEFVAENTDYGNPFGDECKWYDHEEDMIKISKKYPEMVFHLHGEGEETGDIWDKHFKNGKMQVCKAKIVIPPYDENQLM